MISTQDLIDWARNCHRNVRVMPMMLDIRTLFIIKLQQLQTDVCLVYIVKDHRCHPITDQKLKYLASQANQGGFKDICPNYLGSQDIQKSAKSKKIDAVASLETNNQVILILPENTN